MTVMAVCRQPMDVAQSPACIHRSKERKSKQTGCVFNAVGLRSDRGAEDCKDGAPVNNFVGLSFHHSATAAFRKDCVRCV